jgi:5-formyltetrahydrofolate cyclo-ligase
MEADHRGNLVKIIKKRILRKAVLNELKAQKEASRRGKSLAIKKRLFSLKEFKRAKRILLYVGKHYEIDTKPIIKEALEKGKRIFLPVTDLTGKRLIISEILDFPRDTELGPYEIYQPTAVRINSAPKEAVDLVVLPGIAFDKKGNRLGHGAGYYDRFLKDIPKATPRIALAFDFQVQDADIPTLATDIPVTRIITN